MRQKDITQKKLEDYNAARPGNAGPAEGNVGDQRFEQVLASPMLPSVRSAD